MNGSPLDATRISDALADVNQGIAQPWEHTGGRIRKTFVFKNFSEAFAFMTRAAMVAESLDHHPDWSNAYKTVHVELTTHDAGGLTELDFEFAKSLEGILQ